MAKKVKIDTDELKDVLVPGTLWVSRKILALKLSTEFIPGTKKIPIVVLQPNETVMVLDVQKTMMDIAKDNLGMYRVTVLVLSENVKGFMDIPTRVGSWVWDQYFWPLQVPSGEDEERN